MAKNLSPYQVSKIDAIVAKYTESAFRPRSFNKKVIEAVLPWLYRQHGLATPEIIYCGNPISCQRTATKLIAKADWKQVPLLDGMEFAMWNRNPRIKKNHLVAVWDAAKHITTVKHSIERAISGDRTGRIISFNGTKSSQLACFYEILCEMRRFKRDPYWEKTCRFILESGVFLALYGVDAAILCPNPTRMGFNDGKLHRAYGPAVEWKSGCKLYYLNGMQIPESFFEFNEEEQKLLRRLMSQKNAAVRAAIIRKVGIDRVISALGGHVLDEWNGYELIQLEIPGMKTRAIYLKMINPSDGTVHLEGVPPPPTIMSVQDALAWRDGDDHYVIPEQLT